MTKEQLAGEYRNYERPREWSPQASKKQYAVSDREQTEKGWRNRLAKMYPHDSIDG